MTLIKKLFHAGALGLSLALAGCGGSDSNSEGHDPIDDAKAAIDYVDGQLQGRGYTTERAILQTLVNPSNSYVVMNEYDLHATDSVTGDEQYWEAEVINDDLRDLSSATISMGTQPQVMVIESNQYDTPTLDTMVDDACARAP